MALEATPTIPARERTRRVRLRGRMGAGKRRKVPQKSRLKFGQVYWSVRHAAASTKLRGEPGTMSEYGLPVRSGEPRLLP
jgi:hypothetical protein